MNPDDLLLSRLFSGVLFITLVLMNLPGLRRVKNRCLYCGHEWGTNENCRHCQTKDST